MLFAGEIVVEEEGTSSTSVEVKRTVYEADGTVRSTEVWRTRYQGEKRVVRYGTKPKPEPKPEPEPKPKPDEPQQPASQPGLGISPQP
jgi:uncharacterized protein YabE (DUF348 family)